MGETRPRVLVIDDEFGRTVAGDVNRDRERICRALGLIDVTVPGKTESTFRQDAVAEAVFIRGQRPVEAAVGDVVENDLETVLAEIGKGWRSEEGAFLPWALVLIDLAFCTGLVTTRSNAVQPGMAEGREEDVLPSSYFGLHVLEAIRETYPGVPVAILSSQERSPIDTPIDRLGHCGFVSKTAAGSAEYLASVLWRHGFFPDLDGGIVGTSLLLLSSLRDARRLSTTRQNVLLTGDRGTGKELFAKFIHRFSDRGGSPLVTIDCGSVVEELFASDLFGHLPGAFTGATRKKTGRIVIANGSHMFLDEVGNMPMRVQEGLLRVIDDGLVTPVGAERGKDSIQVDVRFIFATNADLEGRALAGTFKADLLDRLRRGGTIALPPLRARKADIPALAARVLEKTVAGIPDCQIHGISPEALALLREHDWPGNVRELEDCVRQAVFRHRDVRTLYPAQLELPGRKVGKASAAREYRDVPSGDATRGRTREDDGIRNGVESPLCSPTLANIHGMLPKVRARYARVVANLLAEALLLTVNLDGSYNFTGAVDRLRGSKKNTTDAADEIKRILKVDPSSIEDLTGEAPLKNALEWALSTRPSMTRKARRRGTEES